jgi:hypothetical protein
LQTTPAILQPVGLMQSIHSRSLMPTSGHTGLFLTRTPIVTPESRVIYCLGAAEDITRTSFPTGRDDLKSNGISMKSIEAGCVWQREVSRKEALRIVQKASKKNRRWSVFSTGGFVFKSAD